MRVMRVQWSGELCDSSMSGRQTNDVVLATKYDLAVIVPFTLRDCFAAVSDFLAMFARPTT